MEEIIYIGEYLSDKLTSSLQSSQRYNYLFLHQDKNCYLLHINLNQKDANPIIPHYISADEKKIAFECTQNKQMLMKKKIEKISDQQIHQKVKKFLILSMRICGYRGMDSQIVGYKQDKNIMQIQQVFAQAKDTHTRTWNQFHSEYHKASKVPTKSKIVICDILPILQLPISVLLSPKQIKSNQFSEHFMFCSEILIAINAECIQENIKILSKKTENLISKSFKQNNQSNLIYEYFLNVRFSPVKIFNPHMYLKPIQKQKYELLLVKGVYEYYHYDDQYFNDRGWGCAYRAFQTLLSWLHIQGYTKPMQKMISILDIQQNIDKCDRSRRLKGKNDWIGATEISWLVPKMTSPEIYCKILHLSDGKQVLDKCEEFKHHFLTSGCPIMYGGGQYAYSIVGMYYNWKLGECEFLILDPHYTGEDEYGKIIEKKGLAWRKPEEMFKKGIFYNFCMPIIQ